MADDARGDSLLHCAMNPCPSTHWVGLRIAAGGEISSIKRVVAYLSCSSLSIGKHCSVEAFENFLHYMRHYFIIDVIRGLGLVKTPVKSISLREPRAPCSVLAAIKEVVTYLC